MKTQVAIIGAGPAGTLLALMLHQRGIESIVVEHRTRNYVLQRVRAGVLERTSVDVLRAAGFSDRLDAEGHVHDAIQLGWGGEHLLRIDFAALTGKTMVAYGQTELQRDLYAAADAAGLQFFFDAPATAIRDIDTDHPVVECMINGTLERIECDIVAGCDGFHGVSRLALPAATTYEKAYPFGWLGILSETPPLPTLVYANHERGFALCSERNPQLSRYYVQCSLDDTVDDWPDDRFWDELLRRVPKAESDQIVTGPSIEKSIAPLRSLVVEPMQHGNLFLVGDAAHIVPPTGAKGLNLAISDVYYLVDALAARYAGDPAALDNYSARALRRVWSSVRFSWWMTTLMHRFDGQTDFDQRIQEQELDYLARSSAARTSLAEQYVGLDL